MRHIVLHLFFISVTTVMSQSPPEAPYYQVRIWARQGEVITARWKQADSTGITIYRLDEPSGWLHLSPSEIYRVDVRRSNASSRNAFWGACIGFAVGFSAFFLDESDGHGIDINQVGRAAGGGILGAFIGSFTGFAAGKIPQTYVLAGSDTVYFRYLHRFKKYNSLQ
jgi:hypothetical protein